MYRHGDLKYIVFDNPWQDRVDPELKGRITAVGEDHNEVQHAMSGFRSKAEQVSAANAAMEAHRSEGYYQVEDGRVYNSSGQCMVAAPGTSNHNYSMAVDVASSSRINQMTNEQLAPYGLVKPMDYECWHVQTLESLQFENLQQKQAFLFKTLKENYPMDIKGVQMLTGLYPDGVVGPNTTKAIEDIKAFINTASPIVLPPVTIKVAGTAVVGQGVMYNGHAHAPVRLVSEALGRPVDWNDTSKTATV